MILVEVLIFATLALVVWKFATYLTKRQEQTGMAARERKQRLRIALESRDYRRLDDWLVVYGDEVDDEVKEHVMSRRAEMYVDDDVKR